VANTQLIASKEMNKEILIDFVILNMILKENDLTKEYKIHY